jgi:hypothetical protein
VVERALEDEEETGTRETAARTQTGAVAAGTGSATLGVVVGDGTAQNGEDRRGAEVVGISRWPVVEETSAGAVATVAGVRTLATDGSVVGEAAT